MRMFQLSGTKGIRRTAIHLAILKKPDPNLKRRNQGQTKTISVTRSEVGDQPTGSKGGLNVAEQLGLHAPFRSFASRSAGPQTELRLEDHRRKRRRRSSSLASFLEPAFYPNVNEEGDLDQDRDSLQPKKGQHQHQHTHIERSSRASSANIGRAAKTYERRPRHKTREDRYDLQKDKKPEKTKDVKSKAHDKPKKKRKGVQKSGAALMQNFSAGNIDTDRLTLKATAPVGLFGKGRASSPVRRKGLPDLTFSEVNFLNHGRGNQEDKVRSQAKSKIRKEAKAADAEAEFSRFFATSKDTSRVAIGTIEHGSKIKGGRSVEVTEDQEQSSLPPVDLPEKPFLGFGSCGPGHVSPVMPSRPTIPNDYNRLSPIRRSLSTRSTSYFTWSRSSPSMRAVSENQWQSRQTLDGTWAELRPRQRQEANGRVRSPSLQSNNRESYEVRCTSLSRHNETHKATKEDLSIDRHASVPESIHDYPNKISAGAEHATVNSRGPPEQQESIQETFARDNPHPQGAWKSDTETASLLASQNRSELLAVVLDLLLGKTSAHTTKSKQSLESAAVAGSKGENYVAVSEVVPKSQIPYEPENLHGRELPHADPNLPFCPERPASARQLPDTQRSQSACTNDSKYATPTTKCHPQNPVVTLETNKTPERVHPSQHDQLVDRPSRVIGSRPNTSNAWTGYRNIYQEQIDMQTSTASPRKIYTDVHQGSLKRLTPPEGQGLHTLAGESRPRWVNPHHPQLLEDDLLQPSRIKHGHPSTHEIDTPAFRLPETFDGIDEMYPQQRDEASPLDHEPHHDFLPEAGRQLPFDEIEDGFPGGYLHEGESVSHRFESPSFLGARASWNLGHEERFPSSGPHQYSNTQDRAFELLNHAGHGDVEVEEKVPLAGFWKPHRLY
ncbi:MAG: hypothetical protein Q9221_006386 [Calogaya cf. arnoldii]